MSNESFFYAGYGVKAYRPKINRIVARCVCCEKELSLKYCPDCGGDVLGRVDDENDYGLFSVLIPEEISDYFNDKFSVIYPEGRVAGLNEGECYIILNGSCVNRYSDYFVYLYDKDEGSYHINKLIEPVKRAMEGIVKFDEPEQIVAYYGEW